MDDENILNEDVNEAEVEVEESDEDLDDEDGTVDDDLEEDNDDDDDELNSDTDDDEADDDEEGGDGEDEEVEDDETPTDGGETDLKTRIAELEKKIADMSKSEENASPSVKAIWQRDFEAVKAKYPNIKATSVHDFGDRWREIMADKNNGLTAVEAFEVTHLDEVKKAVAQEAVAQKRSKDKFKGTGKGVAAHTINVPPDTYAMFKALIKGMTDKQIEKKYKQFHNL